MKFSILALAAAMLAFAPAAIAEQPTGPSFNCAKASTTVEKAICDSSTLGWWDRQLAKGWKLAQKDLGDEELAALTDTQKMFLKKRNACKGENSYSCIAGAYSERLVELAAAAGAADFFVGSYGDVDSGADLVTYPDGSAALAINTVGANSHTCTFEADDARLQANGDVRWSKKPDDFYDDICTITATRAGGKLAVTTDGQSCQYFCGARAILDGEFPLKN